MSYVINIFNDLTLSDNTMMRRNKLKFWIPNGKK